MQCNNLVKKNGVSDVQAQYDEWQNAFDGFFSLDGSLDLRGRTTEGQLTGTNNPLKAWAKNSMLQNDGPKTCPNVFVQSSHLVCLLYCCPCKITPR